MPPRKERDELEMHTYAVNRVKSAVKILQELPRDLAMNILRAAVKSYDPLLTVQVDKTAAAEQEHNQF